MEIDVDDAAVFLERDLVEGVVESAVAELRGEGAVFRVEHVGDHDAGGSGDQRELAFGALAHGDPRVKAVGKRLSTAFRLGERNVSGR